MRWGLRRMALVWVITLSVGVVRADDRPEAPAKVSVPPTVAVIRPDEKKNEIYLLEQALKSLRVVNKIELPERVYLKRTSMDKDYQHFLTGKKGKLDTPERIMLAGSVVRGDRIGGSKERYYVLSAEGNWRRSEGPEVYHVQNDDESRRRFILTPGPDGRLDIQVAKGDHR